MLKEITAISEYPELEQRENAPFSQKLITLFKAYGLVFLSLLLISAPVVVLADKFVIHILHFKSIKDQDTISFKHLFDKTGYVKGLIYICLIGPLLEETVFRLPLAFKKTPVAISISVAVLLFGTILPVVKHLNEVLGVYWVIVIRVALSVILFFILKKIIPANIILSKNVKNRLIITSIILFGLMHVSNYSPLQWPIIWIYPLYVVPQLFMGWLISYIRFKNGFVWGIALHCIINSMAMGLSSAYRDPVKVKSLHTISNKKPVTDTSNRLRK